MRYKKTTPGSAYGKKKPPAKKSGPGKKKKKTVSHGTRRRSR
jgi:hypothetical protein